MIRRSFFILPCLATAVFALVQQGCSEDEDPAPPGYASSSKTTKGTGSADAALRHDLAWVSAAAARCSQQGAGKDCASKGSKGDLGSLSVGVKPRTATALPELPTKSAICAIVKGLTAAAAATADGGAEEDGGAAGSNGGSNGGADASADAGTDRDLLDVWGGRAEREGGGETTAETAVVWDLTRSQSAVFIHPDGGIGAVTSLMGYRGPGEGQAANVVAAFSGMFQLDGEPDSYRVRKPDGSTTIRVSPAELPGGMPPVSPVFLATLTNRTSYVPWDAATAVLAGLPTGKTPTVAGGTGAQYVQYASDPESNTSAGAQMALAMLNQAGDQGDFQSPAGNGALTAIASGLAAGLGQSLDSFCGDGGDAGAADGGASCTGEAEGYCGGDVCGWNGGSFCCRPEPTGNEGCQIDDECVSLHGAGWFCGLKTRPVASGETQAVCTQRATCSK